MSKLKNSVKGAEPRPQLPPPRPPGDGLRPRQRHVARLRAAHRARGEAEVPPHREDRGQVGCGWRTAEVT